MCRIFRRFDVCFPFYTHHIRRYPKVSATTTVWGDNGTTVAPCNKTWGQLHTLDFVLPAMPLGNDLEFGDGVWVLIRDAMGVDVTNVDGAVDVKLWVPTSLENALRTSDNKVVGIYTGSLDNCVAHPVFIPSHNRAERGAFLHWGTDVQSNDECTTALRILVVRHDQYNIYKRHWGKEYLVLQLPRQMTQTRDGDSVPVTAEQGKIGFSRFVYAMFPRCSLYCYGRYLDDYGVCLDDVQCA